MGAEIDGSNDPDFADYTPIWISVDAADEFKWYEINAEDFDDIGSFRYYRYFNTSNHGDVGDVELYGYPTAGGPGSAATAEPADPNAPAILWDFNSDNAMDANMGANSGANAVSWTGEKDDEGNEYYVFTASGSDPYVSVDLSAADVSDVVWVKARVKNDGPATAIELFGHTDGRGLTGSECTHIDVGADGEWHTYIVYIPDANVATVNAYKDPQYAITEPYWAGTVDWIRIDPMWQEGDDGNDAGGSMNDGDQIKIDYIAFFSSEEAAKAFRADQDSEYVAPSKGLATVEEAAAGKNIITGYEFVSGTNGFGGEGAENLWDGDTGTKFCTNEFPVESIAKLDGVYDITGFTMATANDNADYNGRSPSDWTISVSADGENWTELAKGDDSFFEEKNFTYYVGEGTAEGVSYVKFNATATPANLFQVSEVTLFGDKAADVTEELTTKEEAPNTFDFGIVAAVAAVVSLAGFAISKKH
jgi:F5/8 type C domain.